MEMSKLAICTLSKIEPLKFDFTTHHQMIEVHCSVCPESNDGWGGTVGIEGVTVNVCCFVGWLTELS